MMLRVHRSHVEQQGLRKWFPNLSAVESSREFLKCWVWFPTTRICNLIGPGLGVLKDLHVILICSQV